MMCTAKTIENSTRQVAQGPQFSGRRSAWKRTTTHHASRTTATHNAYLVTHNTSKKQKQQSHGSLLVSSPFILGKRSNGQSQHAREPNGTSMDYESAFSTVDCVVGRRVQSAHANNSTLTLPLLLLLCAEAVHVSIHNGVSIQICRCFWLRRGHLKKKRPKKTESVFRFRFFGVTEKPTLKSRFSVAKNRKKNDQKNDFRFSVDNPEYSSTRQMLRIW